MEKLFIDESGSMTVTYCDRHPYFVIAIVRAKDSEKLKRVYKRFVSKYHAELKSSTNASSMFDKTGRFKELKGSAFSPEMRKNFVNYFCRNKYFELFYVIVDNRRIAPKLYCNTSRAFNFFLKETLQRLIIESFIPDTALTLQLDERNERIETKHFLENYLNTELFLNNTLTEECRVTYYDSANNTIIQVADVFANLMYSQLKTGNYTEQFEKMKTEGYLKSIIQYPK